MTKPPTAFSLTKPIHISRLFCQSQNLSASGNCLVTHETYLHQPTDLSLREPSSICWLFFTHQTYLHQPTILSLTKPISVSQLFFHSRNLSASVDYFVTHKTYQRKSTVFHSRNLSASVDYLDSKLNSCWLNQLNATMGNIKYSCNVSVKLPTNSRLVRIYSIKMIFWSKCHKNHPICNSENDSESWTQILFKNDVKMLNSCGVSV